MFKTGELKDATDLFNELIRALVSSAIRNQTSRSMLNSTPMVIWTKIKSVGTLHVYSKSLNNTQTK